LQRHVSPDALHDSLERSNSPKCHPDTRTAVLSWAEDEDSETQVLWLHGPAGAGKTAISHSVAEMSQERNQIAAGFFFSRTAAGRNHEKCRHKRSFGFHEIIEFSNQTPYRRPP
jgi:hypothetical protein